MDIEKFIKEEYVIVFGEYFPSAIPYYAYCEEDEKMPRNNPYFIGYGWATKYATKEQAEKKLNELLSKGFFKDCFGKVCTNVVDDLTTSIIHAYFNKDYAHSKGVSVMRVPLSYYLGKYGAYAYELNKLNIQYNNEHRYQCASNRDIDGTLKWWYLKVNSGNTTEWVDSQDKATCMTLDEQKKWCDIMNDIKPFKGYTQPMNLPIRLTTPQKYHKGQKVLVKVGKNKYDFSYITDVMPKKDGKYHYALSSDALYSRISMIQEGFYEGDDLYSEDMILSFDENVKSCREINTKYDTYYINVILKDGTKIDRINHF